MSVLVIMIPLSLILVIGAGIAFFWAVNHDQFDDMQTPSLLPMSDNLARHQSPQVNAADDGDAQPDGPDAHQQAEQGSDVPAAGSSATDPVAPNPSGPAPDNDTEASTAQHSPDHPQPVNHRAADDNGADR